MGLTKNQFYYIIYKYCNSVGKDTIMISEYFAIAAGLVIMTVTVIIMLRKKYSYERVLAASVMILYLTGVICLTFFPIDITHTVDPDFNVFEHNLKLIPFSTIIFDITRGHLFYFLVQTGGNLIMTIPFGILLPVVYKAKKQSRYALIFFGFTFIIELTQFIIGASLGTFYRTADVDDIILNFTGAMLGYLLFRIIKKIYIRKKQNAS